MTLLFHVAAEKTCIFVEIRQWALILAQTGKVVTSWPKSSVTTTEFIHVVSCRIFMAPLLGLWLLLLLSDLDVHNFIPYLYRLHVTACMFCALLVTQQWLFNTEPFSDTPISKLTYTLSHRNKILRMDLTTFKTNDHIYFPSSSVKNLTAHHQPILDNLYKDDFYGYIFVCGQNWLQISCTKFCCTHVHIIQQRSVSNQI